MGAPVVIHLGDPHVQETKRWAETVRCLEWFVADVRRLAAEHQVAVIVIPGDVFEGRSTPAERALVARTFHELSVIAPVVVARGNHDRIEDLVVFRRAALAAGHHPIHVFEEPGILDLPDVRIYALPHVDKTQAAALLPTETSIETADNTVTELLRGTLAEWEADRKGLLLKPAVMIGHLNVAGSVMSNGETLAEHGIQLSVGDLTGADSFDGIMLNHIHAAQACDSEGRIWYAGTLVRHDFGEAAGPKGYLVWHLSTRGNLPRVEFREGPARQMMTVECPWEPGLGFVPPPGPDQVADADVKIRLTYPADRQAEASQMADQIRRTLTTAHDLRIEHRTTPVTRVRSESITTAETLSDKTESFWTAAPEHRPDPKTQAGALAKLAIIEQDFGGAQASDLHLGPVELKEIGFHGLTHFTNPVKIDVCALSLGLVAITGRTGAGKSTLMGAVPAALYGALPGYDGTLADNSHGSDAYVEVVFAVDGEEYKSGARIDADRKEHDYYLVRTADAQAKASKKGDRAEAIAKLVMPKEMYFASIYSRQDKEGSIVDIKGAADKKDIFARMLGLERYQVAAEGAAGEAKAIESKLLKATDRQAEIAGRLVDLPRLRQEAAQLAATIAIQTETIAKDKATLQAAVEQEATLRARAERRASLETEISELQRALLDVGATIAAQQTKATNNRGILLRADEIRGAAAVVSVCETKIVELRVTLAAREAERDAALAQQDEARKLSDEAAGLDAQYRALMDQAGLAKAEQVANAEQAIRAIEIQIAEQGRILTAAQMKAQEHERAVVSLNGRAAILTEIPCGDQFPTCSLIADALGARDRAPAAQSAADEQKTAAAGAEQTIARLNVDLTQAEDRRVVIRNAAPEEPAEAATLREKATILRLEVNAKLQDVIVMADLRTAIDEAKRAIAQQEQARDTARKTVDTYLVPLEAAEGRIKELESDIARLTQESAAKAERIDALKADLAGLPDAQAIASASQAKSMAAARVESVELALALAQRQGASADARISDLEAIEPQAREAAALVADLNQELAEWRAVARVLGRDGIPALEIDAAGPEISAIINDLLSTVLEGRYSIEFATTRPRADGKGTVDVFDPRVIDGLTGRVASVKAFSGGQKAILNEAISLGIAIGNVRRSGRPIRDLFRDETAGGLDDETAPDYIRMLRRVLTRGDFSRIFFIAHSPNLWALADGQIHVADGRVSVDGAVAAPREMAEVAR